MGPVIHAVGPIYDSSNPEQSAALLQQAYTSAFTLAKQQGYRTLALPYISTGIYGFPRKWGIEIGHALATQFEKDFDLIRFVTLE